MKTVIFDLDNCISDDNWRTKFIDHSRANTEIEKYHKYHLLAPFDDHCMIAKGKFDAHKRSGCIMVILTSRPEYYRYQTEEWLYRKGFHYDALIMRPNNDHSESKELKIRSLTYSGVDLTTILIAYDDRYDVLEAYDKSYIPAERLFIHEQEQ
jgi:hypothetical protein